ncbi:hypothetical protein J2Z31_001749 [Sinorhizobium kostiense]|uniref:Uncharacterized protein n=1 Tax=Sinorhizobium kostiense TaxID=76747 RepID=A0ABS4QX81_9HYPH|nr:hypothetical protein [Sinorhizobium kostiense]
MALPWPAYGNDRASTDQTAAYLFQGSILLRAQGFDDNTHMCIDPTRATIAAKRLGPGVALFTLTTAPAADTSSAHTRTFRCSPVRQALRDRRQNPNPQIHR